MDESYRPNWLRWATWAGFFLIMALWAARNAGIHSPSALVGQPAPDFSSAIVAGNGAAEGDRVALSSLRGNVVMLDFWASWCGPCRHMAPTIDALAARYSNRGLVTFGINIEDDASPSQVAHAHHEFGSFPTLHDRDFALRAAFQVHSIPTVVLIDRHGVVRAVEVGVFSESHLDSEIRAILEDPQ